jgi:hypothetical protein
MLEEVVTCHSASICDISLRGQLSPRIHQPHPISLLVGLRFTLSVMGSRSVVSLALQLQASLPADVSYWAEEGPEGNGTRSFHPHAFLFFLNTKSHYVAQASLKLAVFLSQPFECWDHRCISPHLAILRTLTQVKWDCQSIDRNVIFGKFFCVCGAGDGTQSLGHTRQVL